MQQALIFANGDVNDGVMVRRALTAAPVAFIIAADGGARVAQYYGVTVHAAIGDMDSLSAEHLAALTAAGVEVHRYPTHKNETDLELALQFAVERGARWIRIVGAVGDRLDQTLSNIYLMALPILEGCDVRLVAGRQETRLLSPGEWTIEGEIGDTISLIPLSVGAHSVRTENLEYPLRDEDLLFGPARGVSNVLTAPRATVTFREGKLLLVHTIGKA